MTEDIVGKISNELSKGIDSEAQVLYLLVEIRKIRQANVSQGGVRDPKTFLDFYRDWACHVELTHDNAVGMFLDRFEDLVDLNLTAHEIARSFIGHYPAFFRLDELRNELTVFLESEGLATDLTNDPRKWHTFARHLLGILKDCSVKRLRPTSEKIEELTLKVDDHGNAKFKFRLRGRRDRPICKLKWKAIRTRTV